MHPARPIAAVVALEDVRHDSANCSVLVAEFKPAPLVEVRAAWQFELSEKVGQGMRCAQGINQLCLLPVRQELPIDAQLFFSSSFAFFRMSCSSFRRLTFRWRRSTSCSSSSRSELGEGSCRGFMDTNASSLSN